MPYTAGTQGADANCAKTYMEGSLHTALTAVLTYVEERTNATVTSRVYKSPAANNFFGSDWFLIVLRTADTAAAISFGISELYDSTGHLCKNYGPQANNLTPTSVFAVNDATGKAPTDNGGSGIGFKSVSISTSGFQYWLSILADRVVIATRVATSDCALYLGLYDDFQASAISPFPLTSLLLNSTAASANGFTTREPGQLSATTENFHVNLQGTAGSWIAWTPTPNEMYSGKYWLSRVVLSSTRSPSLALRGLLRDTWVAGPVGSNGDTLSATINGVAKTLVQTKNAVGGAGSFFVDSAL